MKAKALMFQGTGSHVGKTLLVAAFCKIFSDLGFHVAPFKAQNMSLNSYATRDGREIARAQALQALAAGVEPKVEMNPILLKPKGDGKSQVIVLGKPYRDYGCESYYRDFALDMGIRVVRECLDLLMEEYDLVLIEGAGSPVEVNIYDYDIANMKVAEIAGSPVLLVADIDRGGVFASIYGTLALLKPEHRELVKGVLINKFRGRYEVLKPGLDFIEKATGKPVLGVIPYVNDLSLPFEDSVSLEDFNYLKKAEVDVNLAVVKLPRISNFTDFQPLSFEPDVSISYVKKPADVDVEHVDALILPGTKNTVSDLAWVKEVGFDQLIYRLRRLGKPIIGVCGGYQMLGEKIVDEEGVEGGVKGIYRGLSLLNVETYFKGYDKHVRRVKAVATPFNEAFSGEEAYGFQCYEIHMGVSEVKEPCKPAFRIVEEEGRLVDKLDGALSEDCLVIGTYLHGLFDDSAPRRAFINFLRKTKGLKPLSPSSSSAFEKWRHEIERFADIVLHNVDLQKIAAIAKLDVAENCLRILKRR